MDRSSHVFWRVLRKIQTHRHWYCIGHLAGQPWNCCQKIPPHFQVGRRRTSRVVPSDWLRFQSSEFGKLGLEAAACWVRPQIASCRQMPSLFLRGANGLGEEIDQFDQKTGCAAAAAASLLLLLLLLLSHFTADWPFHYRKSAGVSDFASECVAGDSFDRGKPRRKVVRSASTASRTCCQRKEVEKEEKKRSCRKIFSFQFRKEVKHFPNLDCVKIKEWKRCPSMGGSKLMWVQFSSSCCLVLTTLVSFWFWMILDTASGQTWM